MRASSLSLGRGDRVLISGRTPVADWTKSLANALTAALSFAMELTWPVVSKPGTYAGSTRNEPQFSHSNHQPAHFEHKVNEVDRRRLAYVPKQSGRAISVALHDFTIGLANGPGSFFARATPGKAPKSRITKVSSRQLEAAQDKAAVAQGSCRKRK